MCQRDPPGTRDGSAPGGAPYTWEKRPGPHREALGAAAKEKISEEGVRGTPDPKRRSWHAIPRRGGGPLQEKKKRKNYGKLTSELSARKNVGGSHVSRTKDFSHGVGRNRPSREKARMEQGKRKKESSTGKSSPGIVTASAPSAEGGDSLLPGHLLALKSLHARKSERNQRPGNTSSSSPHVATVEEREGKIRNVSGSSPSGTLCHKRKLGGPPN